MSFLTQGKNKKMKREAKDEEDDEVCVCVLCIGEEGPFLSGFSYSNKAKQTVV